MSNIIKKIGSAISKNREEAKSVLDKHKVPYGAGKNSELILASFKAIKAGNVDLATDLSGLIELEKANSPEEKKNILTKIKDRIESIRDKFRAIKKQESTTSGDTIISASEAVSNADGDVSDPIEVNAKALVSEVQSGDPEVLSARAVDAIIMVPAVLLSLTVIAVIIVFIFGIDKFAKA